MAIVNGLGGMAFGKVGTTVYSVNSGVNIARAYQAKVSNPSTSAQVNQRAKLKLMSQLAACFAPVIVIPKDGLKSARNQFIAKNFTFSSAVDGVASITIDNVQLTNGSVGLPSIVATRDENTGISVALSADASAQEEKIVYIIYSKTSDSTLQYMASAIVETAGDDGTFPYTFPYVAGDIVIFAYGMASLSAQAKAKYANLVAADATDLATLVATRSVSYSDYQFTQTRGGIMYSGENEISDVPAGYAKVIVSTTGNGTVSGAGTFEIGSNVTVVATPNEGYILKGWRLSGSEAYLSTDASYTFELAGTTQLIADFEEEPEQYTVTVHVDSSYYDEDVVVSGGTTVEAGESVTVTTAYNGSGSSVSFIGWYKQGTEQPLSSSQSYTFTPTESVTLLARWSNDE